MQFICLIYSDPAVEPKPGTAEMGAYMQAYGEFSKLVQDDGKFVGGEALQDVETASTVSVRDGKVETMDGPFAETKETLGGFYILDCSDLDEALSYAAKIPTAAHGRVEVRPIMVFERD
ncbi:MAG: YciI family protein [Pseudomonadota bacterium]